MSAIILASSSRFRAELLRRAGIGFTAISADLPEDAMMLDWQARGLDARDVAGKLAFAKAMKISALHPEALVIGCDQMMICGNRWFAKPKNRDEACEHLRFLSGQTHRLFTAVAVVAGGKEQWAHVEIAHMTMRPLDRAAIDEYLGKIGDAALQSVGCYQIEGLGANLFDAVEGDFFAIIGLPLIPLLKYLRGDGR